MSRHDITAEQKNLPLYMLEISKMTPFNCQVQFVFSMFTLVIEYTHPISLSPQNEQLYFVLLWVFF
ncbi:unnamed protein product [Boreogadus saida]